MYNIFRFIYKIALQVYFRQYKVINKEVIPHKGPLIVVANHPSTFTDPIIAASLLKQQVCFIAKGTLFKGKFKNWWMRNMAFSIPVHRKQDNPALAHLNKDMFEHCFQHLESKGTLILFPEGTSIRERKLREIKTGAARIALGAEARNDFKLGTKLLCIGINYTDPQLFRSDAWINIEDPIELKDYKEAYLENDRDAVKQLTEKIKTTLEKNLILIENEDEDQFIRNVETLYKNELVSQFNLDPKWHGFPLTKGIEQAVKHFDGLDEKWAGGVKLTVNQYFNQLSSFQLEDRFLTQEGSKKKPSLTRHFLYAGMLLLGLPFFLYGLLTNYLPYLIPGKVAKLMTPFDAFRGPIKMTVGIFSFGLFYSMLILLFMQYWGIKSVTALLFFALSLPLSGYFAMSYYRRIQNFKSLWAWLTTFYKHPLEVSSLIQQRKTILEELAFAKDHYLGATKAEE